jgi:hypothetical protein
MKLVRGLRGITLFLIACSLLTGIVAADGCGQQCLYSLQGQYGSCCGTCGCVNQSLCPFGGSCGYNIGPVYINLLRPDFIATPVTGLAPLSVQFKDSSTGGPTSWAWDFGDGSSGYGMNPTHTYLTPGTYTVTVTISRGQNLGSLAWGVSSTTQKTQLISVSPGITSQGTGASPENQGSQEPSIISAVYSPPSGFRVPDLNRLRGASPMVRFQAGNNVQSLPRGGIYGY